MSSKADHAGRCAQRQRTGAHVDVQRSELRGGAADGGGGSQKALANARVPLPAFPNAARAQAMFLEEMQLAVLGRKTPKEAVAAIVERITPLMTA